MTRKFIPGALVLGLFATASAQEPAAAPAKAEATTPPIEVPAKPKLDPAVIASPAITTIVDATGLLIYLSLARGILHLG